MLIFPAIDFYEGQAVRLFKGDYNQKTVYAKDPLTVAMDFLACGATHIHMVDLEGAKTGGTPNLDGITRIKKETGLFAEVGGGIRSMETVEKYLSNGIDRVILGSAAVTDPAFLEEAAAKYGKQIAVGVDILDGCVAIHGWIDKTELTADAFCERLTALGIKTVICTDISKDGAMMGTNHALYTHLNETYPIDFIASGGVSDIGDVKKLREKALYGAIIGKAYYTKAIDLREAIEVAK